MFLSFPECISANGTQQISLDFCIPNCYATRFRLQVFFYVLRLFRILVTMSLQSFIYSSGNFVPLLSLLAVVQLPVYASSLGIRQRLLLSDQFAFSMSSGYQSRQSHLSHLGVTETSTFQTNVVLFLFASSRV